MKKTLCVAAMCIASYANAVDNAACVRKINFSFNEPGKEAVSVVTSVKCGESIHTQKVASQAFVKSVNPPETDTVVSGLLIDWKDGGYLDITHSTVVWEPVTLPGGAVVQSPRIVKYQAVIPGPLPDQMTIPMGQSTLSYTTTKL